MRKNMYPRLLCLALIVWKNTLNSSILKYHDRLELLKNSDILKMFELRINAVQKELAHFEQVKKIHVTFSSIQH
ncbi:long chain fatty acid CoA ligase [Haemophilus influenzae]|uniref:Long chain fatty acid CoA ligase n=1 Tax=Haemophilus influenzae TaxID=727 RepID=A0A2X1PTQ6_HAEIF|nr:long chain fatty acid CoA ligase [Haemophilus influenzae]